MLIVFFYIFSYSLSPFSSLNKFFLSHFLESKMDEESEQLYFSEDQILKVQSFLSQFGFADNKVDSLELTLDEFSYLPSLHHLFDNIKDGDFQFKSSNLLDYLKTRGVFSFTLFLKRLTLVSSVDIFSMYDYSCFESFFLACLDESPFYVFEFLRCRGSNLPILFYEKLVLLVDLYFRNNFLGNGLLHFIVQVAPFWNADKLPSLVDFFLKSGEILKAQEGWYESMFNSLGISVFQLLLSSPYFFCDDQIEEMSHYIRSVIDMVRFFSFSLDESSSPCDKKFYLHFLQVTAEYEAVRSRCYAGACYFKFNFDTPLTFLDRDQKLDFFIKILSVDDTFFLKKMEAFFVNEKDFILYFIEDLISYCIENKCYDSLEFLSAYSKHDFSSLEKTPIDVCLRPSFFSSYIYKDTSRHLYPLSIFSSFPMCLLVSKNTSFLDVAIEFHFSESIKKFSSEDSKKEFSFQEISGLMTWSILYSVTYLRLVYDVPYYRDFFKGDYLSPLCYSFAVRKCLSSSSFSLMIPFIPPLFSYLVASQLAEMSPHSFLTISDKQLLFLSLQKNWLKDHSFSYLGNGEIVLKHLLTLLPEVLNPSDIIDRLYQDQVFIPWAFPDGSSPLLLESFRHDGVFLDSSLKILAELITKLKISPVSFQKNGESFFYVFMCQFENKPTHYQFLELLLEHSLVYVSYLESHSKKTMDFDLIWTLLQSLGKEQAYLWSVKFLYRGFISPLSLRHFIEKDIGSSFEDKQTSILFSVFNLQEIKEYSLIHILTNPYLVSLTFYSELLWYLFDQATVNDLCRESLTRPLEGNIQRNLCSKQFDGAFLKGDLYFQEDPNTSTVRVSLLRQEAFKNFEISCPLPCSSVFFSLSSKKSGGGSLFFVDDLDESETTHLKILLKYYQQGALKGEPLSYLTYPSIELGHVGKVYDKYFNIVLHQNEASCYERLFRIFKEARECHFRASFLHQAFEQSLNFIFIHYYPINLQSDLWKENTSEGSGLKSSVELRLMTNALRCMRVVFCSDHFIEYLREVGLSLDMQFRNFFYFYFKFRPLVYQYASDFVETLFEIDVYFFSHYFLGLLCKDYSISSRGFLDQLKWLESLLSEEGLTVFYQVIKDFYPQLIPLYDSTVFSSPENCHQPQKNSFQMKGLLEENIIHRTLSSSSMSSFEIYV